MTIKNLAKCANRIKKAIRNKERIILYGDADLDGISSVIILKESILNLGGKVKRVYFPDREKEGYGINEKALSYLKRFAPALLITLDCGISNFKEINLANHLGFEVIVIDHHEVLEKIPEAKIIVDPKQKGDKYQFKNLATSGIIYKLAFLLLKNKITNSLKRNFLELVALSTIADMMPEVGENKIMIEEGLFSLENTWRPGLKAFFEIAQGDKSSLTPFSAAPVNKIKNYGETRQIAQKIISALNIVEIKNHLNETYLLLSSDSTNKAKIMAENLLEKRYQKQIKIKEITEEIEEIIFKKIRDPIIFEGATTWPLVLLGSVASRICHRYQKPTFIFNKRNSESRGAVRTPLGINSVALMEKCKKCLITYGGHPQAAGFTIKNENLEKFKECLTKNLTY